MLKIIGMTEEELINLDPQSVDWLFSTKEFLYIAKTLGAYWQYDYKAARQGRAGMHALLKSGLHSDGFFVSRIFLQYPKIREIMASQLVSVFAVEKILNLYTIPSPDWIVGIPDGATQLGQDAARRMGVKSAEMKKEDGRIVLLSTISVGETLLLVDDFCTRGTGVREVVSEIVSKQPKVKFLPWVLYILNRGGLREILIAGIGSFKVLVAVEHRINEWNPSECPLCPMGSVAIKPKETDENWRDITTSQLPIS